MIQPEVVVAYVTAPESEAEALARALVDRRVAACVNLIPGVRSVYRWEGAVHDDRESLLVIKTSAGRVQALKATVIELHSYSVPEVVVLPVLEGNPPYLAWVLESTQPEASP